MNILGKFASGFGNALNKIFGLVDDNTSRIIKNSYFFLIFVLCIVGIVFGFRHGRDMARIKSAPLIENTNEVFDIAISREKAGGNFRSLLESEVINESRDPELMKARPAEQERMSAEFDKGIVDSQSDRKIKSADLEMRDKIFDENYRAKQEIPSDTKPLKREARPLDRGEEPVLKEEPRVRPVEKKSAAERDPGMNYLEKRRGTQRKPGEAGPKPILRQEGIIKN